MSFDEPNDEPAPPRSRLPLLMLGGLLILLAAFFVGRALAPLIRGDRPAPTPAAEAVSPETRPVTPPAAAAPAPTVESSREAKARPRKKAEATAPAEPAPAVPTAGELRITSDVAGAMVFLDRVYLGSAPVTASNVTPGSHHLNVSAEGYDGYSETIQVSPGPAEIVVRFREIRLNESVDVVHKHGIGSCEGRLVADPQGVRYETANKDDAFSVKLAEIEVFEVDYLKKNLRIKRRGGKTWNFTTTAPNADPLFVFHRNVEKVRTQVAGAPKTR